MTKRHSADDWLDREVDAFASDASPESRSDLRESLKRSMLYQHKALDDAFGDLFDVTLRPVIEKTLTVIEKTLTVLSNQHHRLHPATRRKPRRHDRGDCDEH